MVWGVFTEHSWRLRVGGMGSILGVETAPMLRALDRAGVPPTIAEDLLAACEGGLVSAMSEKDDPDGEGT